MYIMYHRLPENVVHTYQNTFGNVAVNAISDDIAVNAISEGLPEGFQVPRSHVANDIPIVHATYTPRYNALTQSLRLYLITKSGLKKRIRVMVDDGSMLSIIDRALLNELCLKNENRKIDLAMFVSGGTTNYFKNQFICDFRLQSLDQSF